MNKIFKIYTLILFSFIAVFSSCSSDGYEKTETGLKYKFFTKSDNPRPQDGEFIILNIYIYNHKDSLIYQSNNNGMPDYFQLFDSLLVKNGGLEEALSLIKKGDSVSLVIPADTLYAGGMYPPGVESGKNIRLNISVIDQLKSVDFQMWQIDQYMNREAKLKKKSEEQLLKDIDTIERLLTQKDVKYDKTESGLIFSIDQKGNGEKPTIGQTVFVNYRGTLLDGTPFDNSYDRGQPLDFPIGQGRVIKGWDEGILLLDKGAKATLYIPSKLAYGERNAGDIIKPNSILIFEVELVDFK